MLSLNYKNSVTFPANTLSPSPFFICQPVTVFFSLSFFFLSLSIFYHGSLIPVLPSCTVHVLHFHFWNSICLMSSSRRWSATQARSVPFSLRCDLIPGSNFPAFISCASHATFPHKRHMLSFRLIPFLSAFFPSPPPLPRLEFSSSKHIYICDISPNVIPFPSVFLVLLCLPIVPIFPLTLQCSSRMFLHFPLDWPLRNPLLENWSTKLSKIMLLASSFLVPSFPFLTPFFLPRHNPHRRPECLEKNCVFARTEKNTLVRECRGNSIFRDDGQVFASAARKGVVSIALLC